MNVREDFLRETVDCVRQENAPLALEIEKIMQGTPVDRPPLADAGYTDYYAVRLNDDQIAEIASILLDFEASAVSEDGDTTPKASHYAGMVDFWTRMLSDAD